MSNKSLSQECFYLIKDHFDGSNEKTFEWFYTINGSMSGKKPIDYIKEGKSDKLLNLIKNCILSKKG